MTFSKTGEPFGGGLLVPSRHDGMAVFDGPGRTMRLIRNHEVTAANAPFPVPAASEQKYDASGTGGCMTLDFDPHRKRLVRQFVSIAGTINNCSGGWSWGNTRLADLRGEQRPARRRRATRKPHGYVYFVPASADSAVPGGADQGHGALQPRSGGRRLARRRLPHRGCRQHLGLLPLHAATTPTTRSPAARCEMLGITDMPDRQPVHRSALGVRLPVYWVPIPVPDPDLGSGGVLTSSSRAAPPAARRSTASRACSAARTAARCTSSRPAAAP